MALATFHFEATLPAEAGFLEPLTALLREALAYAGTPTAEAGELARALQTAVEAGLDGRAHATEALHFRMHRSGGDVVLELSGSLPPAAPSSGPLADVDVQRHGSRIVYRLTRAVADV